MRPSRRAGHGGCPLRRRLRSGGVLSRRSADAPHQQCDSTRGPGASRDRTDQVDSPELESSTHARVRRAVPNRNRHDPQPPDDGRARRGSRDCGQLCRRARRTTASALSACIRTRCCACGTRARSASSSEFSADPGNLEAAALRGLASSTSASAARTDDPMLRPRSTSRSGRARSSLLLRGTTARFGNPPNFPAFYPHVLTVGATERANRSRRSRRCPPTVDLAAPGVDIPTAEPIAVEPSGYATDSAARASRHRSSPGPRPGCGRPGPKLDNSQLFEVMRRSATDIGAPGFDSASGYGLLNIPRALSRTKRRCAIPRSRTRSRGRSRPRACSRARRRP